jgi:hypothetical protein
MHTTVAEGRRLMGSFMAYASNAAPVAVLQELFQQVIKMPRSG